MLSFVMVFINAGAEKSKMKPNGFVGDVTQAVKPRCNQQNEKWSRLQRYTA